MSLDIKRFVSGLHDYLDKVLSPMNARMAAFEARINLLESQTKNFVYLGVWESGRTYLRHNVTTRDGGMWIVRAEQTLQRPGDSPDWVLCVKRGRDGRDATT